MVAAVLLYAMRKLERWLHEHIFKVGWLITKKQRTTTLLYYTFFIPGVFLHEFVRWLTAGILDVRADRAIKMPDEQQVAELKLNFIRLNRNVGGLKLAVINLTPLLTGIAIIWYISQNILDVPVALQALSVGGFEGVSQAALLFVNAPDVWIWVYLVFTIANTMMPSWEELKGWRVVLIAIGSVAVALVALGIAQQVFLNSIALPMQTAGHVVILILGFVITVDLLVTAVLGTTESIIERITGDSATFQNGKLIAMTRKERLKQQEQERQRRERQEKAAAARRASAGPPSIYNLPLPIPDAPGKDLSPAVSVRREEPSVLQSGVEETGSSRLPPPIISAPKRDQAQPTAPATAPTQEKLLDKKDGDEPESAPTPPRPLAPPIAVPERLSRGVAPAAGDQSEEDESPPLAAIVSKPLPPARSMGQASQQAGGQTTPQDDEPDEGEDEEPEEDEGEDGNNGDAGSDETASDRA